MAPHDAPEPEPMPPLASFASELSNALQAVDEASNTLRGSGPIGAVLLLHLAARLWSETDSDPELFQLLAQTLITVQKGADE